MLQLALLLLHTCVGEQVRCISAECAREKGWALYTLHRQSRMTTGIGTGIGNGGTWTTWGAGVARK